MEKYVEAEENSFSHKLLYPSDPSSSTSKLKLYLFISF